MTSAHDGATAPGSPGGRAAAGATPPRAARSAPSDPSDSIASGSSVVAASTAPPPRSAGLHELEEAVDRVAADGEDRPPPAGPATNLVVAAAVVALGGAALLTAMSLGAGNAGQPGPGTWPLLISVAIVVLGLGLAAAARHTSDAERFTRSSWLVVAGLATMVGFVAVIGVIGFEIPAAVLTFVWLRFLGGETWRSSIVTSIGVVVAFYLIFVAALSVPIPHLF